MLPVLGNKMTTKAQGRTFWIVVTAIVALVVLVILLMIFTGKTGLLETNLLNCEGKGGFCTAKGTATDLNGVCNTACSGQKYSSCSYSSAFGCKNSQIDICCLGVKK